MVKLKMATDTGFLKILTEKGLERKGKSNTHNYLLTEEQAESKRNRKNRISVKRDCFGSVLKIEKRILEL